LSSEEFIGGMITIFTEPYEKLVRFIFDLYDFTKKGEISRKEIQTVFSYIPLNNNKLFPNVKFKYESNLFTNQLNSQQEINFYLDKIFSNKTKLINHEYFTRIIEEISSEAFLFVNYYLIFSL